MSEDHDTGDTLSRNLDRQGDEPRSQKPAPTLVTWREWLYSDEGQRRLSFEESVAKQVKEKFALIMKNAQTYSHAILTNLGGRPTPFKFEGNNVASAYAAILDAVLELLGLSKVQQPTPA